MPHGVRSVSFLPGRMDYKFRAAPLAQMGLLLSVFSEVLSFLLCRVGLTGQEHV